MSSGVSKQRTLTANRQINSICRLIDNNSTLNNESCKKKGCTAIDICKEIID